MVLAIIEYVPLTDISQEATHWFDDINQTHASDAVNGGNNTGRKDGQYIVTHDGFFHSCLKFIYHQANGQYKVNTVLAAITSQPASNHERSNDVASHIELSGHSVAVTVAKLS